MENKEFTEKAKTLAELQYYEWTKLKLAVDYAFESKIRERDSHITLSGSDIEKAIRSRLG